MVSVSVSTNSAETADGPRPVNLRTDLGPLADLIELAFASSMDSSGRAAIDEMRALSRISAGQGLLANLNGLAVGIRLGYVWVAEGKLVGNVSVYPADWPSSLGRTWIIANVAVHPEYQRRGIARRLMQNTMNMIRQRGGTRAILQVDHDNAPARHLYHSLGFVDERGWTTWRRSSSAFVPPPLHEQSVFITRRQPADWQQEYALAKRLRPFERGGMGWQRPLHPRLFRKSFVQRILDWINLRSVERLAIHSTDGSRILGALWIERGFAVTNTQLTLMVDPTYAGLYDDALIGTAVRRYQKSPLMVEHPMDETLATPVLEHYRFHPRRSVIHMRWDVR